MPKFVASIEVFFDAESTDVADEYADALGGVVTEHDSSRVHVTAVTSGAALDVPKAS